MKIVGSGLIGSKFKAHSFDQNLPITIFCSGVSNSSETKVAEYNREESLILSQPKDAKIVYFSTCSIFDSEGSSSLYVTKKIEFENIIRNEFNDHLIIRLPQVVGKGGNINNLINFFYNSVNNHHPFKVQKNAYRNLIDIDDVFSFTMNILLKFSGSINIASPYNTSVLEIIRYIEFLLGKNAVYQLEENGSEYNIDIRLAASIIDNYLDIFHKDYAFCLLKKYFEN